MQAAPERTRRRLLGGWERRLERSTENRITHLANVYTSVLRPEGLERNFFEDSMHPRQARELLHHAVGRSLVDELGPLAAARIVRAATNGYLLRRYALRMLVLTSLPTLVTIHGLRAGILLQGVVYLTTRPLTWLNRGRGSRIAERLMRHEPAAATGAAALRRALGRSLTSIPAAAVHSHRWGDAIVANLPPDEAVREIAIKLADQYHGSVDELVETSRALAN